MLQELLFFAKKGFGYVINIQAYYQLFFLILIFLSIDIKKWQRLFLLTFLVALSHITANILVSFGILKFGNQHITLATIVCLIIYSVYIIIDTKTKSYTFQNLFVFIIGFIISLLHPIYSFHHEKILAILYYNIGFLGGLIVVGIVLFLLLLLISKIANTPTNKCQKVINAVAFLNLAFILYDFYY